MNGFDLVGYKTTFHTNFGWIWAIHKCLYFHLLRNPYIGLIISLDKAMSNAPWFRERAGELIILAQVLKEVN